MLATSQSCFSRLLATKLKANLAPQCQQNAMERRSLLAELDRGSTFPLTLITAPAGFGKTTLVSQWQTRQQAKNQRVGWLSLEEADNQVVQFAEYFTKALSHATDLSFSGILFQGDLIDYCRQLLVQLAEICTPFYLVLDDYHHIQQPEIHNALRFWLKHQPTTMRLILLSRTIPLISITHLQIQHQLFHLTAEQLAFSFAESKQFFEQKLSFSLTEQELVLIYNRSKGWQVALQLILEQLNKQPDLRYFPEKLFAHIQADLEDYLSEEVLHYVEPKVQHFLLNISVLRTITPPILIALTTDETSLSLLDNVEKQGLFLERHIQENGKISWAFQPMFAHYLAQRCRISQPKLWGKRHQQAVQQWLVFNHCEEALYHAQILADPALIYPILLKHGWQLFHQGRLKLVEDSLNLLVDEQIWQNSQLVLLKAWLAQSQHRYQEVSGILQTFQPNQPLENDLQAHFDVLKAQVAINKGDEEQAYQLASYALRQLSSKIGYAQVVAHSIMGEAQHCRGYLKEGLRKMQNVERMAVEQRAFHQWLWSKLQQAEILSAQGFWQSAFDLLKETSQTQHLHHTAMHQIPMHEFLLRLKGQILWEWHQLDEAEAMANAGIKVLENESDQAHCLTLLAKISLTKGDLDNAGRLIEQVHMLLASHSVHRDWFATFDEVQMLYWQISDEKTALDGWLAQAHFPTQEHNHFQQRQWRNIARCYLLQGRFEQALEIINRLLSTCATFNLISDMQRALILRNRIYYQQGAFFLAQKDLIQALNFSQQTNFISAFVIEGELMAQQIRQLLQLNELSELVTHKAKFILRSINQHNRHKFAHFDEEFVQNLLKNSHVPELLKISPLTAREWQVLGLIYAGYSNEQISQELVVAVTTIKTHIRNLYQKIGVENRVEAIEYTKSLLKMMGYH